MIANPPAPGPDSGDRAGTGLEERASARASDPLRIAFLGPRGTLTHAALQTLALAGHADLAAKSSVSLAIDALRTDQVDAAFVPLESSIEGSVPATLDELVRGAPVVITHETYLPVSFDLLAKPGTQLINIRDVATHPHAEAQTRDWRAKYLPTANVTLIGSTALGAQGTAEGLYGSAIAHPSAGRRYGLSSIACDIADNPGAVTRFVMLRKPGPPPPPSGNDRTSIVAYLRKDRVGALLEILSECSSRGINLTRIESRPTKSSIGQYCFFLDCEGHVHEERVGDALAAIYRSCAEVRFLGSYPRGHGGAYSAARGLLDSDFVTSRRWLDRIRAGLHGV